MFTSNLCVEFKAAASKLSDVTREVYGSHSYATGYLESLAAEMFELLTKKQKKEMLATITRSADEYEERAKNSVF
jgi:hypothetical protein